MITPKFSVGGRNKGVFSHTPILKPVLNSDTLKKWVLTNNSVSFTFIEDPLTGVRLASWSNENDIVTYNKSKNLWELNLISTIDHDFVTRRTQNNAYSVYPRKRYFTQPSVTPIVTDEGRKFIFVWSGINFDRRDRTVRATVRITALLATGSNSLDISAVIEAERSYTDSMLEPGATSVLAAFHFPTIIIEKSPEEEDNESFIISVPVAVGYTYHNPFKYLRTPRFPEESFQYSHLGERCYAGGHVGYPLTSISKYNFGCPGGLTMPALVIGNKQTRAGTLIYGMDQIGTNPKSFQFYVDDENLHIKAYHVSDEQIVPNGVGGYQNPSLGYSQVNAPSWSLRIRPFNSNSTWLDWRGFEIYKEEAVPEQISYGWLSDSFYNQAAAGQLTQKFSEAPIILNLNGYTTGTLDTAVDAIDFYKNLYKKATTPELGYDPFIPIHYQTVHLNYSPNRSTGTGVEATYNGWYNGAGQGTAVVGPDKFQSPDYLTINDVHASGYQKIVNKNSLLFNYNYFPFVISSGSDWTLANSGLALVSRSIDTADRPFTDEEYRYWEYSGAGAGVFNSSFSACFGVSIAKDYFVEVGKAMASYGVSCYHDTLGAAGRGCVATSHNYRGDAGEVIETHPRAYLSNYFNSKQLEWLSGYTIAGKVSYSSTFDGPTNPTPEEWANSQASEYPGDMYLKYVPIHAIYEPLGPILNIFLNKISDPRPGALSNYFGATEIDGLDDSTIQLLLAAAPTTRYWSSYITFPNWIQKCPSFQIAHSTRCIQNEWASVFATNTYPNFFYKGVKTGIGTYGQIQRTIRKNEEEQSMEWAAYAVRQWPYSNRMSVWHLDNQVQYVRPDLSGIENSEVAVFNSSVWSGHVENLITRMLRIQSYNPDYIYHGSFKHPLESWTTDYSSGLYETIVNSKCTIPNNRPISGTYEDHERVEHFVRKHRNNDNLLIVVGNWYSGNSTFSATFNPANYSISNGYQVYSLDVNTAQHGIKTLLETKSAGQPFNIDVTLGEFDYKVFEIEVNTFVLDPNIFSDLKTDYVPIRYSYDVTPILSNSTTFSYSYGSSNTSEIADPMVGYRSPSTQQILNNLPNWVKGRQSYDSNMWKLTNSWGMSFDNVLEQTYKSASDLNLITADTTYLSKLSYIDITSKELLENRTKKNLLFNSSFSIKDVARTNLPSGWELYGQAQDTKLDYRLASVSPCSISSDNGVIKVGQQVILDNKLVNKMTASIYVLCNAPNVDVKLFVSIEKTDGTSYVATGSITSRSPEWVRLVIPMDIKAQVYRANFTVLANCSGKVSICAPQLELETVSNWGSSYSDYLPYYPYISQFNSVFASSIEIDSKKIPVHQIFDEKLFIDTSIPTRVVKVPTPSKNLAPYTSQAFGRKVDQQGQVSRTEFSVLNNEIIERSISPSSWDIYNRYSIKDLRYYEDLIYGVKDEFNVSIVPIATAVRKDMLFAICKETYNNKTYRTLKVMRPRSTPNGERYLESITDFNLDLKFDTVYSINQINNEEVFSISFSDIDPSYMQVTTTNNNKYYYKLYFDYYYFNNQNNRLYMIEDYKGANITVI